MSALIESVESREGTRLAPVRAIHSTRSLRAQAAAKYHSGGCVGMRKFRRFVQRDLRAGVHQEFRCAPSRFVNVDRIRGVIGPDHDTSFGDIREARSVDDFCKAVSLAAAGAFASSLVRRAADAQLAAKTARTGTAVLVLPHFSPL